MGHGPAMPIKFRDGGPRPGPAHETSWMLGAARPGPTHHIFKFSRPGPARPSHIKKMSSARPGPSQFSDGSGPVRPDHRPMASPGKNRHPCTTSSWLLSSHLAGAKAYEGYRSHYQ